MKKISTLTIGDRIRKRRLEIGLSQKELAEKVKVSYSSIARIENNSTNMSVKKLLLFSKVLDLTLDYILKGKV